MSSNIIKKYEICDGKLIFLFIASSTEYLHAEEVHIHFIGLLTNAIHPMHCLLQINWAFLQMFSQGEKTGRLYVDIAPGF